MKVNNDTAICICLSEGNAGNGTEKRRVLRPTLMSSPAFMPVTVPLLKKPDEVQDLDKKHTVCHLTPNGITGYSSATDKE